MGGTACGGMLRIVVAGWFPPGGGGLPGAVPDGRWDFWLGRWWFLPIIRGFANFPIPDERRSRMPSQPVPAEADDDELPAKPLSADEARRLRATLHQVSPLAVVGSQVAAGVVGALLAWWITGRAATGWSVAYGALAVAGPAALFARALARRVARGAAGPGWLGWELVKLGLTVALLVAAPRLVPGLHWLGLLAGVVLATKMYWVAFAFGRRPRRNET